MAEGTLDSGPGEEQLIPGLPDDISMLCLARISHGFEGVMQCVSKRWRDAFRSEEIGRIRASEGLSGDWLFVYTGDQSDGWQAYDPSADRWHLLPPAPGFGPFTRHICFCCVVFRRRLLVLGGTRLLFRDEHSVESSSPSNHVLCFDPFFRRWTELPRMRTPRNDFECAVIDGCVLVTGGRYDFAESFDPERNTWEAVPGTPLNFIRWVVTDNGLFQVLSCGSAVGMHDFILSINESNVMPRVQTVLNDLRYTEQTEIDRRLYEILDKWLGVLNSHTREWRTLSSEVSGYGTCPYSSEFGSVEFKRRLYLFGGIKREYDANIGAEVNVKLSSVWYCNISDDAPLYWRPARPLLGRGGYVLACATLRQE